MKSFSLKTYGVLLFFIALTLILYGIYSHKISKENISIECKEVLLPNDIKLCLPKEYFMSERYDTQHWDVTKRQSVGFRIPKNVLPIIPDQYKTNFELSSLSITFNDEYLFTEKRSRILEALHKNNQDTELKLKSKFANKSINIFSPINEQVYFVCKNLLPDSKEFCFAYVPWSDAPQGLNIEIEFSVAREDILNWKKQEAKVKSFIVKKLKGLVQADLFGSEVMT